MNREEYAKLVAYVQYEIDIDILEKMGCDMFSQKETISSYEPSQEHIDNILKHWEESGFWPKIGKIDE